MMDVQIKKPRSSNGRCSGRVGEGYYRGKNEGKQEVSIERGWLIAGSVLQTQGGDFALYIDVQCLHLSDDTTKIPLSQPS